MRPEPRSPCSRNFDMSAMIFLKCFIARSTCQCHSFHFKARISSSRKTVSLSIHRASARYDPRLAAGAGFSLLCGTSQRYARLDVANVSAMGWRPTGEHLELVPRPGPSQHNQASSREKIRDRTPGITYAGVNLTSPRRSKLYQT